VVASEPRQAHLLPDLRMWSLPSKEQQQQVISLVIICPMCFSSVPSGRSRRPRPPIVKTNMCEGNTEGKRRTGERGERKSEASENWVITTPSRKR
jgi:hypothetical protein